MSRESSSYKLRPFMKEDGRNESLQAEIPPTLSTPKKPVRRNFWLTKSAPTTFALIFIACASALVGLSRFISRKNGLPLSITSIHYSWTYGPTVILVIILASWKQADYQYKSMQPWWELVRGPSPASHSVLLDYLSPFQPLSCFEAFKNGHYVVAISVLNYFILKIIILISTTLFVVQPTLHKESIMIHYDNSFDIENMQKTLGFSIPESWIEWREQKSATTADVPVWSYLAEINSVTAANASTVNQSIPTHQSFTLPSITSNMSSVSAPVDIFIPTVTCEEASLSFSYSEMDRTLNYHLNSSNCFAENVGTFSDGCEDDKTSCAKSTGESTVKVVECLDRPAEMIDSQARFAVLFGSWTLEYDKQVYVAAHSIKGSLVLCDIRYGMVTATASQYLPDRQIMLPDNLSSSDSSRHMPNMTDRDLTYIVSTSLDRASWSLMITSDMPDYRQGAIAEGTNAFLQLVATNRKWIPGLKSFQQPSLMIEISTEILLGISKAFAQTVLLGQNSQQEPSEATAEISENRLHIRSYSLWPMVAGFILLSALCLFLLFIIPEDNIHPNITGSIASHATVLATSPSMLSTLRNAGHYRTSQLKARLGAMLFKATVSDRGLSVQALGSGCINPQSSPRPRQRSWIPLSARLPMVALLFLLPLLLIAILELLQRLSENLHGFFNLANSYSQTWSYVVRLTSTLVAFLTATMFNNLDSTIAILAPFSRLRLGSVPVAQSVMFHLLGVSPLLVLFETIRLRQIGPAASNLAAMLGSLLTIAVSGLWITGDPFQTEWNSTATVQSWNTSWPPDNFDDGGAGNAVNIIRHGGAETPVYIQDYAVLPRILFDDSSPSARASNNTYQVAVLRPVLECIALPQEDIVATLEKPPVVLVEDEDRPEERQYDLITLKMKVSTGCFSDPTEKEHVTTKLEIGENKISDYMWVGQFWDLDVNSGSFEQACPSVSFLFGKLGSRTTAGVLDTGNLTALFCSQGIDEFPATVTYEGNPEDIHLGDVRFHPEKKRAIHNEMNNGTSFNFRPGIWFTSLADMPLAYNDPAHFHNDYFFDHLMFGPDSLPLEDLVGPENIQNLTNAVSHNYREFIAHVLDHNFRSEIWTPINGVSWQMTTRISIHRTSKVILQALLAAMTVLGLIGYKLVKLRGTLPRNPCSIASTMGFLADSQLCDPDAGILPTDAGTTSEQELGHSLRGYVFSLGWWEEVGDKNKSTSASLRDGELGEPCVVDESKVNRRRHFGIDVGQADALGFAGKDKG